MKLVKQIGYKLIVVLCIVMTFCCFIASTPVEASKVSTGDFYYAGTTKGSYTVNKGLLERIIDALGEILDYLIGLITMGIRIVFVGWTVLLERCLTWILEGATGEEVDIDSASSTAMTPSDEYITLEAIFFNRVPLLDINIFNMEVRTDVSPLGEPLEEGEPTSKVLIQGKHNNMASVQVTVVQGEKSFFSSTPPAGDEDDSLIMILKKAIAGWYYTFRLISIMIMLVLLVYIGIKLAMQSAASEKALYKRVLVDWVVGMILVFSIHYIMLFIIQFNEILVTQISKFVEEDQTLEVYEYGLIERAETPPTNAELESSLYEEVRTRAYDARMTVGFTGMIMYMVLVFYAWKYTFIYLKRYLTIAVLVIVAPIVALTYAFNKVQTGKSQIFTTWLKEFVFTVILQSVHALLYVVFVDTALQLSLASIAGMIIAFISLHFVGKAEQIFRKIFNIQGNLAEDVANGSTLGDLAKAVKAGAATMGVATLGKQFSKGALRLTTKPLRMAGNATFGGIMAAKANGTFSKNKNVAERKANYEAKSNVLDLEQAEKKKKGRIATNLLGSNLKNAMKHPFNKNKRKKHSTIGELEENLENLKKLKGKSWINEYGEEQEVTDELIEEKEEELNEIKEVNGHKLASVGRYFGSSTRGAFRNILNPYQYVELGADGKYHRVKTERNYQCLELGADGKYHRVERKRILADRGKGLIAKKTDSVGKRFLAHFERNKEEKDALKAQLYIINNQISGFLGILVGLPALVAEPKLGIGMLALGASRMSKVVGKSQNFKDVKVIPAGQKFKLKGFAGTSEKTIADTALEMAREEIIQSEEIIEKQHKATIRSGNSKKCAGNLSLGRASFSSSGYKVVRLNKIQASYVNTCRVVNKIKKKADDEQFKSADEFLASKYHEMEGDKHKAEFTSLYLDLIEQQSKDIDGMSDDQVRLEVGYEEAVEVKEINGIKRLAGDAERKIIDKAIIETAQKTRIMDIGELTLTESTVEQIKTLIVKELRDKDVLPKGTDVSTIIENLDQQIKQRHAKLATEGTRPVEERIADQAIIETMKESGITDPEKVSEEAVIGKFQEIYSVTAGEPTKKTVSVTESLQAGKPTTPATVFDSAKQVIDIERTKQIISTRQTHFSQVSKSDKKTDELKEKLKRRKESELDATIIEAHETFQSSTTPETTEDEVKTNTTDAILQLLNYQTEMHKSYELAYKGTQPEKAKLKAFKAELFDEKSSVRTDKGYRELVLRDGTRIKNDGSSRVSSSDASRKVYVGDGFSRVSTSDGSIKIEDLLIEIKNRRN